MNILKLNKRNSFTQSKTVSLTLSFDFLYEILQNLNGCMDI